MANRRKRPTSLEAIAKLQEHIATPPPAPPRMEDIGMPVLDADGPMPARETAKPAPIAVPELPPSLAIPTRNDVLAVQHMLEWCRAKGIATTHVTVGSVTVGVAPGGGGSRVTGLGGLPEAASLYEQYGGELFRQLEARGKAGNPDD